MLDVYKELEPLVSEQLAKSDIPISCKPGCAACCSQLPLISLAEGVAMAEHVLKQPMGVNLANAAIERCMAQLKMFAEDGLSPGMFFRRDVPCTFLGSDRRCRVYAARPSSCRHYYVVSDPVLCSGPEMKEIVLVDLRPADKAVMATAFRAQDELGLLLFYAPLPVIMPWAFKLLTDGLDAVRRELDRPGLGLLNLYGWIDHLTRAMVIDEYREARLEELDPRLFNAIANANAADPVAGPVEENL